MEVLNLIHVAYGTSNEYSKLQSADKILQRRKTFA